MAESGTQTRRLRGSKILAKLFPVPSSTTLMLRSLRPLSRVGSGRSAAALLKNSITWPRSTTGLATLSFLQN